MSHPDHPDNMADHHAIIEEARACLEKYRQMMAQAGLTPESCLESLRRAEGPAAVEKVRREAAKIVHLFEEETARQVWRVPAAPRPVSRRAAGRRII